jgi:hypothetical protein
VTVTLWGLMVVSVGVTVTLPIYVLVDISTEGFMDTVITLPLVPVPVMPPEGRADSQAAPSVVDALVLKAMEDPLLVALSICGDGAVAPVALNVNMVGFSVNVFGGVPTPAGVNVKIF